MEILVRPFQEPELLRLAYGFEQATHDRKPTHSAPAISTKAN
jgi:hypothetical protein